MERWRKVWREGIVPFLSDKSLKALKTALLTDDPKLLQGSTTSPPPLQCVQDWDVEAACGLGFCGWKGEGLTTVVEVETFFAQLCYKADERLGEVAAVRYFLNWFDDTPRPEMRRQLLAEVNREMSRRLVDEVSCSNSLVGPFPAIPEPAA